MLQADTEELQWRGQDGVPHRVRDQLLGHLPRPRLRPRPRLLRQAARLLLRARLRDGGWRGAVQREDHGRAAGGPRSDTQYSKY